MHTVHAGLSIAAAVKPGRVDAVNAVLKELNSDPGNNAKLPFAKSLTTQLVSGIVIPSQDYHGQELPATLMLMTSYTGPFKGHLDELVNIGAQGLRALFFNCIDFPGEALKSDDSLKRYIKKHRYADTFYTGMQYITHTDIGREENLRTAIESYIDEEQAANGFRDLQPEDVRKKIQEFVNSKPEFSWAKETWRKTFSDFRALWGGLVTAVTLLFVVAPCLLYQLHHAPIYTNSEVLNFVFNFLIDLVIVVVAIMAIALFLAICYRLNELQDHNIAARQPDDEVRAVLSTQNHPVMNEMTIAGPLKKGWIHPVSMAIVLKLVSLVRGSLPIPTIATARWLTIDKGRRLVFISNFENLSESYVRDFIDSRDSAWKINLLFGQGDAYPPTKWIVKNGAITNPDAFLNNVHLYQHITRLWYWPYMDISVDNINLNRKIRLGLFSELTDTDVVNWLKLF